MSAVRRVHAVLLSTALLLVAGSAIATGHDLIKDDHCGTGSSADQLFYAGGPPQYWYIQSGGWNNCHLETFTSSSRINYAHWYLPISTDYQHQYSLQAYVSSAGFTKTTEAIYYIWPQGHSGGVQSVLVLDQRANQGGFCYILGSRFMYGPQGGFVEIIDANSRSDGVIYVDVFCYRS